MRKIKIFFIAFGCLIIFFSFSLFILMLCASDGLDVNNYEEINQNNIDKLLSIKGSQICPKADKVSNSSIELANRNRLGVRLWGIRDEEIMQKVYKLNIEGMTVNFPDKLKVLIEGE